MARIAWAKAAASNSNNVTTAAIDTTGATVIGVIVTTFQGGSTPAMSDSKGNTWVLAGSYTSSNSKIFLYYCEAPTVGSGHTFTFSSSGHYPSILVEAHSEVAFFDQVNGATNNGTNSLATGSITPTADGSLLIAGIAQSNDQSASIAIDNSFSTPAYEIPVGNNQPGASAYKIQTTAAAINPTWSWSTSSNVAAGIMSFKPGAAPATTRRLSAMGVG